MVGGPIFRKLLLLIAALFAWTGGPAAAQAGLAGVPLDICVAQARTGDTPARLFGDAARFDCGSPQVDHGPGDFWVLSAPLPAWAADVGVGSRVRVASLAQAALDLNILYADGAIATIPTTSATLGRHLQLGAIVEIPLPPRTAAPVRLLWRIRGAANNHGLIVGQRIADQRDSTRAGLTMAAIYAGFAGLGFALIVYNLALWGALRHRFQLAYCAMVTLLLGYTLTSSGVLAWLAPALDNNDRIRLNYIFIGFSAASAVAFARSFFEPRVFEGWLGRACGLAIAALATSGLIFAAASKFNYILADRAASLLLLAGLSVTGPILWQAWRRGSRYLRLFALAWSVPILFAAMRLLVALHVIAGTFWLDNSTVLSFAFEALVSSLAIAYRVQMLSHERDEARARESQARELADADPLTGLLNRRAFLDRAIGAGTPRLLHLIDIDHFKRVNETLGHDGGDEVLRVFARTLRAATRPGSLIARLGGEEFAVLAPVDDATDAEALLARVRAARMPFDLRVTASIGTCAGPLVTDAEWKTLYRHADRALFEAKSAGRDRARVAASLAEAA